MKTDSMHYYLLLPFVVLLGFTFLVSPGLVLILIAISFRCINNRKSGKIIFATVLAGFLSLFNATKSIEGDWFWYVQSYLDLSQSSLLEHLTKGYVTVRYSEPIFYIIQLGL